MTSHYDEKHRAGALAAGCDAYETKPPDFGRLMALIQSLVAKTSKP
jgi:DNA-binding response OmpR family regulator